MKGPQSGVLKQQKLPKTLLRRLETGSRCLKDFPSPEKTEFILSWFHPNGFALS